MTLATRIDSRRRAGATAANRRNKEANGLRVEEIGAVTDITPAYQSADRAGDIEMESWFQRHYAAQTTEAARSDVAAGFATWLRTERREELCVTTSVDEAADVLRDNNPFWLGAAVPSGSDGAA